MVKCECRQGISCPSRRDPIKAILEFNLPTDQYEHMLALNAPRYKSVLLELAQHIRSTLKYEEHSEEYTRAYEVIREKLYTELEDEGLDLYEEG